jgi:hypothetical protein
MISPMATASTVDVTAPTTSWTVITYANNNPDPSNDQQTGSGEGDVVGNASHPSFYAQFGDANTPSLTDGDLAFRIRLGADDSPAGFKTALFIGIDANHDGALDLFLGVNNSGAANTIGIWNPGAGLNISPNTTSIVSTPLLTYSEVAINYSWISVSLTSDPSVGTATDLNADGKTDYFLSFSIPFNDIVTQLSLRGITGIDQNSTFSYVMATATQANSLNQDLNGLGASYNGDSSWTTLGAIADPITAGGTPVPEINPAIAVTALALLAVAVRSRKRRARS